MRPAHRRTKSLPRSPRSCQADATAAGSDRPREEVERQVGHVIEYRTEVAFLRSAHESSEVIPEEEESDRRATLGAPEEYEPERGSRPGRDRRPDEITRPKAALSSPREEGRDRDRRQPDAEQALQPEGRSGGDGR